MTVLRRLYQVEKPLDHRINCHIFDSPFCATNQWREQPRPSSSRQASFGQIISVKE